MKTKYKFLKFFINIIMVILGVLLNREFGIYAGSLICLTSLTFALIMTMPSLD